MSNGIMSVEMLIEVNTIKVYGGDGTEETPTRYTDEHGNVFTGTGYQAKSYFRGRHDRAPLEFNKKIKQARKK